MAIFWTAKTPTAVYRYTWTPPLAEGDALASYTASATGATIDADESAGDDVILYVSAGTAGQTAVFTLTATSSQGEEFHETIYMPIIASPAQIADTANDYVAFALRKVVGIGESAEADELAHGLEVLNSLVARWRAGGADIGAAFPIISSTVIYCPDWAVSALRYNLLIECAPLFGVEPSALDYELARRGLQLVKHKNLSDVRTAEYY